MSKYSKRMSKYSKWRVVPPVCAIAFLFLAQLCYAQTDSLALSSGTAGANGIASLNLVLTSPAGGAPAAVQFTLTYPAANVTSISVSPGPTATSAGKTVMCALASGAYTCLVYGLNATTIPNGIVAVVNLTVTASVTIGVSNPVAASPGGDAIVIFATGGAVIFAPASAPPTTVSVAPSSGAGLQQTFALQYGDPLGVTDLAQAWVWFNASFDPATPSQSCLVEYVRASNLLYLYNDAGTGWLSPATPGTAGTLSNSQCSINMAAATVTTSGINLTLNLPVTFTAAYAGAKNTYMYGEGLSAGGQWQLIGSWTVLAASEVVSDVSVAPNGGSGLQQTFALQYADSQGATDLTSVWVWFTSNYNTVSAANSCMVYYARATNQLYFLNDAGTAWSSPVAPGTAVTLSNSQCSINVAAASVTVSGTDLTLNLPVTFAAAYAGAKSTYMYAAGSSASSGWQTLGSWTVAATVAVVSDVSVTPNSGSGLQQTTFALQYADSLGATDLASVWVWFTSNYNTVSAPDSCMVYYARATNQLYFLNDAGTAWSSPVAPGAAVTLSNSQCSVDVAAASVTVSGTNLTLNLPVTFTTAYAGAKNTYMYAAGSSASSGWRLMGSWTAPSTVAVVSDVSVTPNSGSGLQQTFVLQYADSLGATDLTSVWVWFTSNYSTVSAPNSCMVYYARATNQLYFLNDAGTVWSSPVAPGAAVTLSNSQCSVNVAAASVNVSGTNLTLNLPVTFAAAYAGTKSTYMYAAGSSANSGWQALGSWTP
jgi:phage baseplate assembly protein gpV